MATGSTLRWESRPQQLCCLEANWDCTLNSDGHTGWLPNNGQLHQLRNFAWKCGSVIRRVNFRWLQRFLWASDKSDPGKRPALSLQKIRIPSSAITASSLSSCYWHHGIEILAMEDRSISDHADSVWPADVWTSAIYPMVTAMAIQVPRSSVVRQLAVATIHIS